MARKRHLSIAIPLEITNLRKHFWNIFQSVITKTTPHWALRFCFFELLWTLRLGTKRFRKGGGETVRNLRKIEGYAGLKVRLLTEDDGLIPMVREETRVLGCEFTAYRKIEDFKKDCDDKMPYFLVVEYTFGNGNCRKLLQWLLRYNPPSGVLVLSNLPGFEDFLEEMSVQYADADIRFFFLEKSFQRSELLELLTRLEQGYFAAIQGCLRLPKYNSVYRGETGSILKAARENLGLSVEQVAKAACRHGRWLTPERLAEIETDKTGKETGCYEWYDLTHLLFEHADVASMGFEPWSHLRRAKRALEEKQYPFPKTFVLRQKLVELERRDRIESHYRDIISYGLLRNNNIGST